MTFRDFWVTILVIKDQLFCISLSSGFTGNNYKIKKFRDQSLVLLCLYLFTRLDISKVC